MTTTRTAPTDTAAAASPAAARSAWRRRVGLDPPARTPTAVPVDSALFDEDLLVYTGPKVRAA